MDVRAGFVQMQRPVQYMNVLAEPLLNGGEELGHDSGQHLWRRAIAFFADLVDGFLGADAGIGKQIVHSAVALGVAGFDVALVLL